MSDGPLKLDIRVGGTSVNEVTFPSVSSLRDWIQEEKDRLPDIAFGILAGGARVITATGDPIPLREFITA